MSSQDLENIVHHRYVPFHLPDPSTPAGKSIARRLHDELFVWLTTVDENGVPHSLPVGFLWDEAQSTLLIYSAPEGERERLANIKQNPRVGLHFDMSGGDFLIITGEAYVSSDDPPSDQIPAWVEKYHDFFSQLGMTMQQAATGAPVALRIRPLMLRYVPNPLQGANPEANKAIVRRYLEMWNTGNVALADEVLAPDWLDHAHPEVTGPESVKQAVSKVRAAFPDLQFTIESIVSEGDIVAVYAAVQRGGSSRVMWFVRIANGKMAEMWTGSETAR